MNALEQLEENQVKITASMRSLVSSTLDIAKTMADHTAKLVELEAEIDRLLRVTKPVRVK